MSVCKSRWAVVCFYPADFTFVCPTEIAAMNAKADEFARPNALRAPIVLTIAASLIHGLTLAAGLTWGGYGI